MSANDNITHETTNNHLHKDYETNEDIEKELDNILNEMEETNDISQDMVDQSVHEDGEVETINQDIVNEEDQEHEQDRDHEQQIDYATENNDQIDDATINQDTDESYEEYNSTVDSSEDHSVENNATNQNILTDDRSKDKFANDFAVNTHTVVGLANHFHKQMYSVRNLPTKYLLVLFIAVPLLYIGFLSALIYILRNPAILNNLISALIYSLILAIPFCSSIVIRHILLNINKDLIVKNHSQRHDIHFTTLNEARVHWIKDRIGDQNEFFEFAEKLSKWKDYKQSYNKQHEKSLVFYIYDPKHKIRSALLLLIFFVTLILAMINVFSTQLESAIINISLFDNMSIEWIAITIVTIILCFFAFVLPMWRMIVRFSVDMFDSLIEEDISEIKFNILINFLLDNADVIDGK